jgi:HD superfamily phosphodiesterase
MKTNERTNKRTNEQTKVSLEAAFSCSNKDRSLILMIVAAAAATFQGISRSVKRINKQKQLQRNQIKRLHQIFQRDFCF